MLPKKKLQKYYNYTEDLQLYILSTILDPCFKKYMFDSDISFYTPSETKEAGNGSDGTPLHPHFNVDSFVAKLYHLTFNRESGSVNNLHACFANIARLMKLISLKPIPPLSLGTHIFHQANQCILFWFSSSFHQ